MNSKTIRPTIRLKASFHSELVKLLDEKGINFQELNSKLLENWVEQNKRSC